MIIYSRNWAQIWIYFCIRTRGSEGLESRSKLCQRSYVAVPFKKKHVYEKQMNILLGNHAYVPGVKCSRDDFLGSKNVRDCTVNLGQEWSFTNLKPQKHAVFAFSKAYKRKCINYRTHIFYGARWGGTLFTLGAICERYTVQCTVYMNTNTVAKLHLFDCLSCLSKWKEGQGQLSQYHLWLALLENNLHW